MFDSVKSIKTLRVTIKSIERTNGVYKPGCSVDKIQYVPSKKMYFNNPDKKVEILCIGSGKALVKPNTFPYIAISLDPDGNIMRKNQHYTIHELGFEFIGTAIALCLSKEKTANKGVTYHGKHEKNGCMCYLFEYQSENFSYTEYTVQPKETISSIAGKFFVNDFMLRTKNNFYNDFGYIKAGTKLQIPLYYCKRAVFYVDEKTMLPISVSVFDDVGLFENYEFYNVVLNKPIAPEEFTRNYPGYGF